MGLFSKKQPETKSRLSDASYDEPVETPVKNESTARDEPFLLKEKTTGGLTYHGGTGTGDRTYWETTPTVLETSVPSQTKILKPVDSLGRLAEIDIQGVDEGSGKLYRDDDSLVEEQFRNMKLKEKALERKVEDDFVPPTEEEQTAADKLLRDISAKYALELAKDNDEELKPVIERYVDSEIAKLSFDREGQLKVKQTVMMTAFGNGPIEKYLSDPDVTEVVVQRYNNVVYEKFGKIEKATMVFSSEAQLRTVIDRIVQRVNRPINDTNPIVDARLKDGSRVNATIPPVSPDGATLTIRKFNDMVMDSDSYIRMGSLNREMVYFLQKCVEGKISIFVSGGTGTGKTTMLNMLSAFIPDDELIITIEDTLELKLNQPNVRRMEVRRSEKMMDVDQKMLVKAALRQRPDRIILGETRDGSVVDLISAMSTGHEGSMSTIHANSPESMCNVRIPILYSMNKDSDFSESSIALQISEAIDVIVQLSRMPDGSRKAVSICYIDGIEDGKVKVREIYRYNLENGCFEYEGAPEKILEKIKKKGVEVDKKLLGIKRKERE